LDRYCGERVAVRAGRREEPRAGEQANGERGEEREIAVASIEVEQGEAMTHLDLGACRDIDPAVFCSDSHDESAAAFARRVCACCVIRLDCLSRALQSPGLDGVWGGLTAAQRARYTNAKQ
jgi:WhiB family redox-sensing transcriptional regulator